MTRCIMAEEQLARLQHYIDTNLKRYNWLSIENNLALIIGLRIFFPPLIRRCWWNKLIVLMKQRHHPPVCVCLCVGVGGGERQGGNGRGKREGETGGGGTGGKRGTGLKRGRSYIFALRLALFRLLILLSLYCRYQEEIVRLRTLLGNTIPAAHSRR